MNMRVDVDQLRLSKLGAVVLASSEGIVPAVYLDGVGEPTYGVGVTKWAVTSEEMASFPVTMPEDIDAAVDHALDLFPKVAAQYEEYVRCNVTVPLHQWEYDALVHFVYNIGETNFKKSKLLVNLNRGDYALAGKSGFHGWLTPSTLRRRRDVESELFLTGDYGRKQVPIYRTNGRMRLAGIVDRISHEDALAMMDWAGPDATGQLAAAAGGPVGAEPERRFTLRPVERPARQLPPEALDVISDVERGGAKSKTNIVGTVMALVSGGGGLSGLFGGLDPNVALAVVAGVVVLGVAYILFSRHRKARKGQRARAAVDLMHCEDTMAALGIDPKHASALIAALSGGDAK